MESHHPPINDQEQTVKGEDGEGVKGEEDGEGVEGRRRW